MMGGAIASLAVLGSAAAVTAATTPLAARLGRALGVVDHPDDRRVNRRPNIPLLGGIAVAAGFFAGLAVGEQLGLEVGPFWRHLVGLVLGGLLLLGLGAVDDRFGLSAWPKLAVQLLAAAVAIHFGFRIDHVTDPISHKVWWIPDTVMWPVTLLWIVAITNAINLIDGLDGLATGVAAIIAATLAWTGWQVGEPACLGVALLGALVAFLPFNFPPARIFLGDTGALFVGYVLALLALEGYRQVSVLTFLVPLLALAVPLMDTALSVVRRLRRHAPVFSADRAHMHHRLLESAGSQRNAVLSLYFLTACFCLIALSFRNLEGITAVLFLALVVFLTIRLLRNLGFLDLGEGTGARGDGRAPHQGRGS